jgi:hypothetical protein
MLGCSDLTAKPFAGTIVEMTLTGAPVSMGTAHYELWARNETNDVIRVSGIFDVPDPNDSQKSTRYFPVGFRVRPAVTMGDPCMIDQDGHLLVTADAYKDGVFAGVAQSAEEQAQTIRARIAQVTSLSECDGSGGDPAYHCGRQNGLTGDMLGLVAYELVDEQGNLTNAAPDPPKIPWDTPPDQRKTICQQYWDSSPLAYTPNPSQFTYPAHGQLLGVLTYSTTSPPASYDSIRADTSLHLKGIQELWFTTESKDQVDANNRGPILIQGTPTDGGREVVHFEMVPPRDPSGMTTTVAPVKGSAALIVNLDEDPTQF